MSNFTGAGGLSKARLARMHDIMAGHVEAGDMPGLVALVSRRGEVHVDAIGKMAVGGAPMQRDSLFRIASMTKPVTAVARCCARSMRRLMTPCRPSARSRSAIS